MTFVLTLSDRHTKAKTHVSVTQSHTTKHAHTHTGEHANCQPHVENTFDANAYPMVILSLSQTSLVKPPDRCAHVLFDPQLTRFIH